MNTRSKQILWVGACSGLLAVALGAFGSHALKPLLTANNRLDTYELGSRYHFYHTLVLLAIGLILTKVESKSIALAAWLILSGTIVFSGSLYMLSLTNQTWLGMITPVGGLCLIGGWACLGVGVYKSSIS